MMSRTGMMRGRSGFTLVEVLVSVVILATGIVFVLSGLNRTLDALDASRTSLQAHLILKETLSDLFENGLPTVLQGSCGGEDSDFRFEISSAPLTDMNMRDLKEVTVTVWRFPDGVRYSTTSFLPESSDTKEASPL